MAGPSNRLNGTWQANGDPARTSEGRRTEADSDQRYGALGYSSAFDCYVRVAFEQRPYFRFTVATVSAEGANGGQLARLGPAGDGLRIHAE